MSDKEFNSQINKKTYLSFIGLSVVIFLCLMIYSGFAFRNRIISYNFLTAFIFNNAALLFLKNLILIMWIFVVFTYSFIIKREDTIGSNGKQVMFYSIISAGINLVVLCAVLYALSVEVFVPMLDANITKIGNESRLSKELLDLGDKYYKESRWKDALQVYENYQRVAKPSNFVKERMRSLRIKVLSESDKNKGTILIPDNLKYYIDIADYLYEKEEYISAWYYYEQVAAAYDTNRQRALTQIDNIKTIYNYRNSLLTDKQKHKYLTMELSKIRTLYKDSFDASEFFKKKKYLEAYFVYRKIINENKNIREASKGKDLSLSELYKTGIDINSIEKAKFFPGKDDILFFNDTATLINIGNLKRIINIDTMKYDFYFFDTIVYQIDDRYRPGDAFYIRYGVLKNGNLLSSYIFSLEDKNTEFFPVLYYLDSSLYARLKNICMENEIALLEKCYTVRNGKFSLNTAISDGDLISLGKLFNSAADSGLSACKLDQTVRIKENISTLYNFEYDYEKAVYTPLLRLLDINSIKSNKIKSSNVIGFNQSFIRAAIGEKIARIFFLVYSLLFLISFSWRRRCIGNHSFYILLFPAVIAALFVVYKITSFIMTYTISLLAYSSGLDVLLGAVGVTSLILLIIMLAYTAGTKA